MKSKNKSKGLTLVQTLSVIALILLATIGVTYAYFSANLSGVETGTTITVTGGTMSITFAGGSAITASNVSPKAAAIATKTMTVTGNSTTDVNMSYTLTLVVQTNTFTASSLKWRLASTNTGNHGTPVPAKSTNQNIPAGASNINLGTGSFPSPTSGGKAHTYTLTIYFPDTGGDQNTDQGKSFTSYVRIANA